MALPSARRYFPTHSIPLCGLLVDDVVVVVVHRSTIAMHYRIRSQDQSLLLSSLT